LNATNDLLQDHVTIRSLRNITQKCSDKLYANEDFPIAGIKIISVVMEEFVDRFHHGKEEQAYFIVIKHKNGLLEDIRKFLIEHELERRIATLLLRNQLQGF
jgi:hemerythrin-like domain-containing protein